MEFLITILLWVLSFFGWGSADEMPTASAPQSQHAVTATVVRVVDGDTIVVRIYGAEETVRYIGIDTPEPYRDGEPACYSLEASLRNEELLAGKEVTLIPDSEDRDRYDRLLRYVYVDDVFVNEVLVREGYAETLSIPPNDTYAARFAELERTAKVDEIGLWEACR